MYQAGTRDFGITPSLARQSGAYDQSPTPKYFVELDGAGHFAWTDLNPSFRKAILAYGVAFMDHYLNGDPAEPTEAQPGIARLRWATAPDRAGAWPAR
jgi:hypothetical protein